HNILMTLDVKVTKIEINDLKDNTFFANIYFLKDGANVVVDARPSDAIALALRGNVPIFVDEKVVEKSRNLDLGEKRVKLDKLKEENLEEFLENLSPEEFGKYKM
ncbi:MAG: bifunctional nuclease family protein, partial [Thermodesulfobacteriota bacterium]|nr:bifunctional nuclease family protein [Thermodesulfobacteriota bacterium]